MELNERSLELAIMGELAKDQVPVTVRLQDGTELLGIIVKYDLPVIVLIANGVQKIIYKNSIASITPLSIINSAQPKKG